MRGTNLKNLTSCFVFLRFVLFFAHASINGAEKLSIFCTIQDTLHDIHTSHMSKAVMELVFKVLRSGLLWYILHTCPKL